MYLDFFVVLRKRYFRAFLDVIIPIIEFKWCKKLSLRHVVYCRKHDFIF